MTRFYKTAAVVSIVSVSVLTFGSSALAAVGHNSLVPLSPVHFSPGTTQPEPTIIHGRRHHLHLRSKSPWHTN